MTRMTLERMALNESAARRAGNYDLADYWRGEAERESDRLERERREHEWHSLVDNRHG